MLRTILIYMGVFATAVASADTYEYTVTLPDDLSRAEVIARFANGVESVSARSRSAGKFLTSAHNCATGDPMSVESQTIQGTPEIRCLAYSVDLEKAGAADRTNADLVPGALVLPVAYWMWRPRLRGDDTIIVTFDLPEDMQVSVPWQPVPDMAHTYRLESSPQSGTGLALFGHFEQKVARVGQSDLRIAIVPLDDGPVGTDVIEWTRQTAEHITLAYGRFPNPHARVLLFRAANRTGEEAVRFGRVVRDGGETVELVVDPDKPQDQFLSAWTGTHEFAHLLLPYIERDERWISEGFAQYYQNVLLARAGRYPDTYAWQKINDGLERGFASAPGLSPNDAASRAERNARMKIYWSGAALFLTADVELRRRSNGSVTLDTVLGRFQSCCLPSRRTWSGIDLFEAFDSLIDDPLFVELYRQHADTAGFPPFRSLLDQLGVRSDGASVLLEDDSSLAEIRAAITAQRYTGEPEN